MRIHHLALRTRDVARLVSFYEEVLGLRRRSRPEDPAPRSVWLEIDDAGALLMIERAEEGEPSVPAGTMDLVALAIGAAERGRWRSTLTAGGVPIEAETAFTMYFRDPDGRRVALSHY